MKRLATLVLWITYIAQNKQGWAEGVLTPLGPVAADQRTHLIVVTAITLIAVLPVVIGTPLILWRYRRGRRAAYRPDFGFSAPLELAMWGVPVLIVAALGVWLLRSTQSLDPFRPLGPDPLDVQVVGLNWKWLFLYPDQGAASVGTLAVPAGRPVRLRLTTDTVMQSFLAPSLAGQIYAMPGMVTQMNFMASRPARVGGANTQFNGTGFAKQKFQVVALSPADWKNWIVEARKGPVLDDAQYAALARPGTLADARSQFGVTEGPLRLRLNDRRLFDRIVARYHDGKALTAAQQPGTPAYRAQAKP